MQTYKLSKALIEARDDVELIKKVQANFMVIVEAEDAIKRAIEEAENMLLKHEEITSQTILNLIEEFMKAAPIELLPLEVEEDVVGTSGYKTKKDMLGLIHNFHHAVGEFLLEQLHIEEIIRKEHFRQFLSNKYSSKPNKVKLINSSRYAMPNIWEEQTSFYAELGSMDPDDPERIDDFMLDLIAEYLTQPNQMALEAKTAFIKELKDQMGETDEAE